MSVLTDFHNKAKKAKEIEPDQANRQNMVFKHDGVFYRIRFEYLVDVNTLEKTTVCHLEQKSGNDWAEVFEGRTVCLYGDLKNFSFAAGRRKAVKNLYKSLNVLGGETIQAYYNRKRG